MLCYLRLKVIVLLSAGGLLSGEDTALDSVSFALSAFVSSFAAVGLLSLSPGPSQQTHSLTS